MEVKIYFTNFKKILKNIKKIECDVYEIDDDNSDASKAYCLLRFFNDHKKEYPLVIYDVESKKTDINDFETDNEGVM